MTRAASLDWRSLAERLAGPLVALLSFLLYMRTMAPSLGGTLDSSEFQQATYRLAISHPTGYPLYLLVGKVWVTLFPFGDIAHRVTLLSGIFGALSVWVLYETVRYITGRPLAGFLGAALFAVQAIPWAQASVAEINTLNNLLTGLAFLVIVKWSQGDASLWLVGLTYGLAISHHRTALLYAPLLLVFFLLALRWKRHRPHGARDWLLAGGLFMLPWAAYLYLPLRAFTTPSYQNTLQGFWQEVVGESALPVIAGALQRPVASRFVALFTDEIFWAWPGRLLALLGAAGSAASIWSLIPGLPAVRKRVSEGLRSLFPPRYGLLLLYLAAFLMGTSFATLYDILDVNDYLGVPVFMWCVVAGGGIGALLIVVDRLAAGRSAREVMAPAAQGALALCLVALLAWTAGRSLSRPNLPVDFSRLDRNAFWNQVKADTQKVPQGSVLIADWPQYNEALYWRAVEGWRPDLQLTVFDFVISTNLVPIQNWQNEHRAIYLLGYYDPVLARYSVKPEGTLLLLTGARGESAPTTIAHRLDRRYGDSLVLLGYTLEPDPPVLRPGGGLNITFFWQPLQSISQRYVVFNHVVDGQGTKIGQKDVEPGFGYNPTVYWQKGQVITDTLTIGINPDAPPGTYRLVSGLYTRLEQERVPAYAQDGTLLGDYPELTTVQVVK